MRRQALLNLFMLLLVGALALVVLYGPEPDTPPAVVQLGPENLADVARIELPEDDLKTAVAMRDSLIEPIRRLGWPFVTLDLAGFRSGSLSETTAPQEDLTT